jgi:hypothetical protein
VSHEQDLSELVAKDAFLYAGSTDSRPPDPAALRRIAGYGSSATVRYEGEGGYFLDRVRPGVWRLEVYPDAVSVRDPFEAPSADKVVTRTIYRAWPMTVSLPDLGRSFAVQPLSAQGGRPVQAADGRFTVTPGVYLLGAKATGGSAGVPHRMGHLGFAEYHAPPADTLPPSVVPLFRHAYVAGRPVEVQARVVDRTPPDSVWLYVRRLGAASYQQFAMRPAGGYVYTARVPGDALREGPHELAITLFRSGSVLTFPGGANRKPTDWNYRGSERWTVDLVGERTPLRLFDPAGDVGRLAFTRIGDAGRRGLFELGLSAESGRSTFRFALPVDSSGWSPPDYTASLVIADRVRAREETIGLASALRLRLRGLGPRQMLHVTLMETDGTSWSRGVTVDSIWRDHRLPLAGFAPSRGVKLPQGFPGEWSYWVGPAEGRGRAGDRPRPDRLERLQLSLRGDGTTVRPGGYGVELESVTLELGADSRSSGGLPPQGGRAAEQLRRDHEIHDRAGSEQERIGAKAIAARGGMSHELDTVPADEVLRHHELALHARVHDSQPFGDAGSNRLDFDGKRMVVGDFDADRTVHRLGLILTAATGAGRRRQQQPGDEHERCAGHVPSLCSHAAMLDGHIMPFPKAARQPDGPAR